MAHKSSLKFPTVPGKTYRVNFTVDLANAGRINGIAYASSAYILNIGYTASGTYAFDFTATSNSTKVWFESAVAGPRTFYLDNVSIEDLNPSVDYYTADVVSYSDYYPFGMQMPSRNNNIGDYRYGYNGMEKDKEIKSGGNSYTTEFRQYDPRLGRWLSLDPLMAKFPWMSPYVAFDDNPVFFTDPSGLQSQGGPGDDPKTHVLKKDENLSVLSKKYKVSIEQLQTWNPNTKGRETKLQIGEEIIVSPGTVKIEPNITLGSVGEVGTGEDSQSGIGKTPTAGGLAGKAREYAYAKDESLFGFLRTRLSETALNKDEVHKMLNYWEDYQPKYNYNTQGLVSMMQGQENVQNLIGIIKNQFTQQMSNNGGNYSQINLNKYLTNPVFGLSTPTLLTLVGGTQKTTVKLTAIEIDYKLRTYQAQLVMSIYDDFGVSEDDITKYFGSGAGIKKKAIGQTMISPLTVFWVLQHQRGYSPMINIFKFNISINGSF